MQDNIEEAIEGQVKKEVIYNNTSGVTSGNLTKSVDEFDIVLVLVANQGTKSQNQWVVFPIMQGGLESDWYTQYYNLRATESYKCSGRIDLSNKTSFSISMQDPVGWTSGDIRCYKIIGIKF